MLGGTGPRVQTGLLALEICAAWGRRGWLPSHRIAQMWSAFVDVARYLKGALSEERFWTMTEDDFAPLCAAIDRSVDRERRQAERAARAAQGGRRG